MSWRPRFTPTPKLLTLLEQVSALRERILSAAVQVPWIPALQKDTRARNTHSSTAIEGNPLTLEEVRLLEEGKPLPRANERARREVLNYFAGLRWIEKRSPASPVTDADVLRLHAIISSGAMDQGSAGRYRDIRVRVGPHIPPRPEEVPGLMTGLLTWWREEAPTWPAVMTSAIVHYRFEEIHPFADGNGRTGRALALWELYRRGFDTHHLFSVDEFYWEDRPRYYASLQAVEQAGGDLTAWLEYSAEGLQATLEKVWVRAQGLTAESRGRRIVLSPRQERLLQFLRERGGMTPSEIWKALGVSRQGALNILKPLLTARLVRRLGTKRTGRYVLASSGRPPRILTP